MFGWFRKRPEPSGKSAVIINGQRFEIDAVNLLVEQKGDSIYVNGKAIFTGKVQSLRTIAQGSSTVRSLRATGDITAG